jgi:hypothetical protein
MAEPRKTRRETGFGISGPDTADLPAGCEKMAGASDRRNLYSITGRGEVHCIKTLQFTPSSGIEGYIQPVPRTTPP